jgi:hypothetical protein
MEEGIKINMGMNKRKKKKKVNPTDGVRNNKTKIRKRNIFKRFNEMDK